MAGLFHILTLALCEGSSFSTFIAALGSVIMSNFSYSDQFIIIFICIFLKVNDVKHLFMWGFFFFFAIYLPFGEMSVHVFLPIL